jgi:hypothetical protein
MYPHLLISRHLFKAYVLTGRSVCTSAIEQLNKIKDSATYLVSAEISECCLLILSDNTFALGAKAPRRCIVIYALAAGLGMLNTQRIALEKHYNKHFGTRRI